MQLTIRHLCSALRFAADQHRDQRRKDCFAAPYINHPIELLQIASENGIEDLVILIAMLLHDTIEDTGATKQQLISMFGQEVADMVDEVSDDKSLPKHERKLLQIEHAAHISLGAQAIKICDKTCNLRDLLRGRPHGWTDQRVSEYFNWARTVVDQIRGSWPSLVNTFDTAYSAGLAAGLVVPDTQWIDQVNARKSVP